MTTRTSGQVLGRLPPREAAAAIVAEVAGAVGCSPRHRRCAGLRVLTALVVLPVPWQQEHSQRLQKDAHRPPNCAHECTEAHEQRHPRRAKSVAGYGYGIRLESWRAGARA